MPGEAITKATAYGIAAERRRPDKGPPRWLAWAEMPRTLAAILALPLAWPDLRRQPRGDGHRVIVIPGFAATDRSTAILRAYLCWLGYEATGWGMGRNMGAATIGIHNERLVERLETAYRESGGPVTLIGWSMGGIMARLIARERADMVRGVITMGAPFTGDPFANSAWRIYERLTGHSLSHPIAQEQIRVSKFAPPVPATAIYSTSDGVVAWQCCQEPHAPHTRSIAVRSAHCGYGFHGGVFAIIARALASPRGKLSVAAETAIRQGFGADRIAA
jgi:pimeloyl-ACP methyl ester carboxylesterase